LVGEYFDLRWVIFIYTPHSINEGDGIKVEPEYYLNKGNLEKLDLLN